MVWFKKQRKGSTTSTVRSDGKYTQSHSFGKTGKNGGIRTTYTKRSDGTSYVTTTTRSAGGYTQIKRRSLSGKKRRSKAERSIKHNLVMLVIWSIIIFLATMYNII